MNLNLGPKRQMYGQCDMYINVCMSLRLHVHVLCVQCGGVCMSVCVCVCVCVHAHNVCYSHVLAICQKCSFRLINFDCRLRRRP